MKHNFCKIKIECTIFSINALLVSPSVWCNFKGSFAKKVSNKECNWKLNITKVNESEHTQSENGWNEFCFLF